MLGVGPTGVKVNSPILACPRGALRLELRVLKVTSLQSPAKIRELRAIERDSKHVRCN